MEVEENPSKESLERPSKWRALGDFIKERLKEPLNHPEFIIYFIVITVIVGAIDVWAAWYLEFHPSGHSDFLHLRISIIGYSIALVSTGGIDLIFSTEKNIKKIIQLIAYSTMIIGVCIFFICFNITVGWSIFIAIVWAIFSLMIWWIANAENANLTNYYDDRREDARNLAKQI